MPTTVGLIAAVLLVMAPDATQAHARDDGCPTADAAFVLPVGTLDLAAHRTTTVKMPLRRVRAFYARMAARGTVQLKALRSEVGPAGFVLRPVRPCDGWALARFQQDGDVIRVAVTPRYHLAPQVVKGTPPPWVGLVLMRSPHAQALVRQQDHLEHPPR